MSTTSGARGVTARPWLHVRALDGMRALAVLGVILFHLDTSHPVRWNPLRPAGGYLGVDVFFVLSGFLITSLLLGEHDRTRRLSFGRFYARRGLRLLPALAVVVVVAALVALADPGHFWNHPTLAGLPWVVFYIGNWKVAGGGAYPLGILQHTWSLAVEEQFYLVWPLLCLLALRLRLRREVAALGLLVGACLQVLYAFELERHGHAGYWRLYYSSDTRCTGLLAGASLAFLLASPLGDRLRDDRSRVLGRAAGVVGLAALVAVAFRVQITGLDSVVEGVAVASAGSALLLLGLMTHPLPGISPLLGSRPLVWIGRRSYGLYLWSGLITALVLLEPHGLGLLERDLVIVAATFVAAGLSFRLVEQPFLARKRRFTVVPEAAEGAVPAAASRPPASSPERTDLGTSGGARAV